jgi:transposase
VRPDRVAGDKGYSSPAIRQYHKEHKIDAVIPAKADQFPDPAFARETHRECNVGERIVNRFTRWRRIPTRDEKRAVNGLAMLNLAAIPLWR